MSISPISIRNLSPDDSEVITMPPDRVRAMGPMVSCVRNALLFSLLAGIGSTAAAAVPVSMIRAVGPATDQAGDDFNLAVGLYRSSRWQLAADTFAQFLKDHPEHPRANLAKLYYGLSLSSLERFSDARPQFLGFIAAEPESPQAADARYRLGECSYYLKDYPAAVSQFNEYLTKHPGHSLHDWAQLFLAESLNGLERWNDADVVFRKLLAKPPVAELLRDAEFGLARSLEARNKPDDAFQLYRGIAADKESPLAARALSRIGSVYFNRQQFAEAVQAYDEILVRYPGTALAASAVLNSGLAMFRSKEFERAADRLRQVPADSPNYAQATLMTAVSLKELGRIEEARRALSDAQKVVGDGPLAADILFQRAQLERTDRQSAVAAQVFEDIAIRWPQDARVAECLFNATELRLELNELEAAERNWKSLEISYPQQAAQLREQILLGRLYLARKEPNKAIETLTRAVGNAEVPGSSVPPDRTLAVGRYYLVRTLFDASRHSDVVNQTRPFLNSLADPSLKDLRSVIALAAISSLELKQFADAKSLADLFLSDATDENQKADVLAARAVAQSNLAEYPAAMKDLTELTTKFAERKPTWSAVLHAAEAATAAKAFAEAGEIYALAAAHQADQMIRESGLSGVAWSHFRGGKFADAEQAFATLDTAFPSSPDAALVSYMRVRAIEELGDLSRAAQEYQKVFTELTADTPAAVVGAESMPPLQYAFDAGRQAARLLVRLKKIEDADQQCELLVTRFPAAKDLDRVLEEWAWSNIEAERFDVSDRIYRRLLDQFPASPFAGTARLSLAESEMQAENLDVALKEFEAIVADKTYGASEKERALFHVIDILTTRREWSRVRELSDSFLKDYAASPLNPQVRLSAAESRLNSEQTIDEIRNAQAQLTALRTEVVAGTIPAEEWTERIWVVSAEAALQAKEYAGIDLVADELKQRVPGSRFLFQIYDVQGRRWKSQAPPDFAKSREYFRLVIDDAVGRGTETAARCQFQIAETYVLEQNLTEARKEYFRVYLTYQYEALQAQAIFQVAECELRMGDQDGAIKSLRELVQSFPKSELVPRAKEKLKELGVDITWRRPQHPAVSLILPGRRTETEN